MEKKVESFWAKDIKNIKYFKKKKKSFRLILEWNMGAIKKEDYSSFSFY